MEVLVLGAVWTVLYVALRLKGQIWFFGGMLLVAIVLAILPDEWAGSFFPAMFLPTVVFGSIAAWRAIAGRKKA